MCCWKLREPIVDICERFGGQNPVDSLPNPVHGLAAVLQSFDPVKSQHTKSTPSTGFFSFAPEILPLQLIGGCRHDCFGDDTDKG